MREGARDVEEQERYLGGIASKALARGLVEGYGLYATTRRLIGVSKKKQVLGVLLAGLPAAFKVQRDTRKEMSNLQGDESAEAIKELLKTKDFEIEKKDVKKISIKKPGRLSPGHLKILSTSGEEIGIKLLATYHGIFEEVGDLMQKFCPEATEVEE